MLQKTRVFIALCTIFLMPFSMGATQFAITAFDNQSSCPMQLEKRNHGDTPEMYQFEPRRITLCSPPLYLGCGFPSLFFHNPYQKQRIAVYFDERYIPQSDIQLHLGKQTIRPENLLHQGVDPQGIYPLVLCITPTGTIVLKLYAEYESRVNERFPICFYPPS